jgi:hypothetical protein
VVNAKAQVAGSSGTGAKVARTVDQENSWDSAVFEQQQTKPPAMVPE